MKNLTMKLMTLLALSLFTFSGMTAGDYEPPVETDGTRPQYVISITIDGKPAGDIKLELFPKIAPKHVNNFDSLVSVNFYDGTVFHRVIPGFMIQGGDPNSKDQPKNMWGMGAKGQTKVEAEFNDTEHVRGVLSAARSQDPNSATSQFFICVDDATFLDGKYTAYGQVLEGMDVVDAIVNQPRDERDNPNKRVEMNIKKVEK